ncbi:MAG: 3'-5' exonuclease domain-containing protein 2 [Tannerella sp.]|jgi:ribonuclease D|nr:3'-5' exonuclease domain-containing protein 2 [Tannerella sp.]
MIFANSITKEDIDLMPREVFEGRIVVVENDKQLDRAIKVLSSCPEIGFDTETRPSFSKQTHYKTALMQLSTIDTCFLIRLNKFLKISPTLEQFIINENVKKIGLSLRDDFNGLNGIKRIAPGNFIDLQNYVCRFGIEELSLRKIYAILFGKKISKRDRLTNWEACQLTEAQKQYAALDAWSCLKIYKYLESIR